MTNLEAKQEAIKTLWGASYGTHEVDKNGWKSIHNTFIPSTLEIDVSDNGEQYRPKSLRGIDNNNGWIRIEPDGSNLPEPGEYRWLFESGSMSNFYYEPGDIMSTKLTHYKPITPELKPIY